jgi:hypothetical protein
LLKSNNKHCVLYVDGEDAVNSSHAPYEGKPADESEGVMEAGGRIWWLH